jgi:uroporphyrinogen-III synthase
MIELRRSVSAPEQWGALANREGNHGVLLTSAVATRFWLQLRNESLENLPVRSYYIVGEQSADLLSQHDSAVPIRAVAGSAAALLEASVDWEEVILYPCSVMRREEIVSGLQERGVSVIELPLYEPVRPENSHTILQQAVTEAECPLALCFFSPSAVGNFFSLPTDIPSGSIFFAAIGQTTAAALRQHGVQDVIVPDTPETVALASAVAMRLLSGSASS